MGKNVANREYYPFSAPGTAYSTEPALRWKLDGRGLIEVKIENKGREQYSPALSGNDITCKLQESDDGIVWTDVTGAALVVKPMGVALMSSNLTKSYLQFLAFGDAEGSMTASFDGPHSPGLLAL